MGGATEDIISFPAKITTEKPQKYHNEMGIKNTMTIPHIATRQNPS